MADPQPQHPPQWVADLTCQWGPPLRHDLMDDPPGDPDPGPAREVWTWHRDSISYLVRLDQLEPSRLNVAGQSARWQVTLQSFGAPDAMQVVHLSTAQAARPDRLVHEALAMAGWLVHEAEGTPAAKCTACGGERVYSGAVPGGRSGHHKPGCPLLDGEGLALWLGVGHHVWQLGQAEIGLVEYATPRSWLPVLLRDIASRIDAVWEQQVAQQGGDQEGGRT